MDIYIIDLNKRYGNKTIFNGFSCRFKKNKPNAIVGRSGKGKTSLINIILGLDLDYSGDIINLPKNKSVVFQENRLLEEVNIYDNINFVLDQPLPIKDINQYLNKLEIDVKGTELVKNLSGGMKRRVAILRALVKQADIYIFDEAFKDMDKSTHLLVLDFIKEELKDKTIIFSTHNELDLKILNPEIIKI